MITAERAAELLGISRGAVYDLAAPRGPLPCYRFGRRCVRFEEMDVIAYLQGCRQVQAPPPATRTRSRLKISKIKVSEPSNCFERLGIKTAKKPSE